MQLPKRYEMIKLTATSIQKRSSVLINTCCSHIFFTSKKFFFTVLWFRTKTMLIRKILFQYFFTNIYFRVKQKWRLGKKKWLSKLSKTSIQANFKWHLSRRTYGKWRESLLCMCTYITTFVHQKIQFKNSLVNPCETSKTEQLFHLI